MIDMTDRGKKIRLADSLDCLADTMTATAEEMERLYVDNKEPCKHADELYGAARLTYDWADAIREDAEKCTK